MKPSTVYISGIPYKVSYVDKSSDVDVHHRASLFGQIDYWTTSIRILAAERPSAVIDAVLLHEILHGIAYHCGIKELQDEKNHDLLDTLATALADTLNRSGVLK